MRPEAWACHPAKQTRDLNWAHADPSGDRWTMAIWEATADLLLCKYVYREEGSFDRSGRWRRKRIVHGLVGTHANQTRGIVMSIHLCKLVRHRSAEDLKTRSGHSLTKRSFERACAEHLVVRLQRRKRAFTVATKEEYDREVRENLAVAERHQVVAGGHTLESCQGLSHDEAAARRGRSAAKGMSLAVRMGFAAEAKRLVRFDKKQGVFGF